MRKRKKFSKVVCWILAVIMMLTLIPGNCISVKAEEGTESINVKLYFLNSDNWETPAINAWDGVTIDGVTIVAGDDVEIVPWKSPEGTPNMKPGMLKEGDNWYYATLKTQTTIAGLQFVDAKTASEIKISSDSNSDLLSTINSKKTSEGAEPISLYYAYGKLWDSKEAVQKPAEPTVDSCTVTVHFNNINNWDKVAAYFAKGNNWVPLEGYEYCGAGYGGLLEKNSKNSGWYSFKVTLSKPFDVTHIKFNEGGWTAETNQYDITTEAITADTMELWLQPTEEGTKKNLASIGKTAGWIEGGEIKAPINPASLIEYKSPVVNADNSVLIQYKKKDTDTFTKLYLMGTITDWGSGKEMSYDDETGFFSIVINKPDAGTGDVVVAPGTYQYKFKDDGVYWFTDPANEKQESGNSVVNVPGMVITGHTTAGDGKYEFTAKGSDAAIVKEWKVYSDKNCSEVHKKITAAEDEADSSRAVIDTTGAETGYYYVQVTYEENGNEKTQVKEFYHTKKTLIYEYAYKEDSKFKDKSDIYTWYNLPFNSTFPIRQEGQTDKKAAYVAIDDKATSFGYIVRLESKWSGDDVSDREFSDRTVNVNTDERYTKVRGGEGIEKPYVLSTGKTGYDNGIVFRYRDDKLFYDGAMDTIKSVKLMLKAPGADGYTAYDMIYDTENELYVYKLQNGAVSIAGGDYKFYFKVNFGNDTETAVQDLYYVPENADTVENVKAAVINYQKYDYDIKASVTPDAGVNSNENPLVSVSVTRKDGTTVVNAIEAGEITSITADISKLGYEGQKVNVSAITGKAVLYVKEGVAAGTYEVPIRILDKYGNVYETAAAVKVAADTSSTPKWDESIIYFLLTDRFYDGSTENNYGCDKSLREDYHGGDFAGLIQKLDYIDSLGVNTIWITPVVDNIDSFYSDEIYQSVGGYTGYWACDFTKLDEHLGTTEEFDKLLDEAHARGIKVMLDIVVNHAGYDKKGDGEWSAGDNPFKGMIRPKAEAGSDSITQWLSSLPDFMTEKQDVRSRLVEWQKAWAAHTTAKGNRVDYFRIDTVKHVEHETWSQLRAAIAEENPGFKMIGEYYGASCINTGDYLADGQMDALLDFDFKSIARKFVDGNIESAEKSLESRNASISNAITMGQFLSSHDETGFLVNAGSDTSKMKVAAALELTAKGIPIVYYGEEINLTGDTTYGSDANNRYDMQFDNLSEEQVAMLAHYKKLIAARNEKMSVFAKGSRTKVMGGDADGYLVFKRSHGSDFAYVGLNTTTEAKTVSVPVDAGVASVKDLYSGKIYAVNGGVVNITIPASSDGGTVILAAATQQNPSSGGSSSSSSSTGGGSSSVGTGVPTVENGGKKEEANVPSTPDDKVVTTNPDGTTTETKTETIKNEAGKEVIVTISVDKDADGNVTGSKEVSVIAEADKNTSATVTVMKDAAGNITSATADVAVEGTSGKTKVTGTISGGVVSQIVDSADTKDVKISVKVTAGDKAYTVQADVNELSAGAKMKVVAINSKTKKYVLVNAETYTVNKDGDVKLALPAGKTYELVTSKEAASIEKEILNTVKVKKKSAAVKKGRKVTVRMNGKLDMDNVSKISYSSNEKSVATVNKNGKVTAKEVGTAIVKAKVTLQSGKKKTVTMKIKVK